jgi:arylsulfatase
MPEFTAPKLGKLDNNVSMEVEVPANANGVLYALGGFSGGLSLYVKDGVLHYEYNLFEIDRTQIKAKDKLTTGKVKIEVESRLAVRKPGAPMNVTLKVNGEVVAQGRVPITAALGFTANDCLDIGSDLGSPVSLDYFDQAPFAFNGKIVTTRIMYPKK